MPVWHNIDLCWS